MSIETIVIIGAGQAGGWAAHALRKEGFAGHVVLLGDERHPPHERPPLSKSVLAGDTLPESTHLFKPDALAQLNLDWRPGVRVLAIDRGAKVVRLADQQAVPYDKVILCAGGRARRVDIPGAEDADVLTLRTIDDALALRNRLKPGRTVAVIGGGWIGLEVAATARRLGADVVVVEALGRLCERTVPHEMSEHLLSLHQNNGVRVVLNGVVARTARGADGRSVLHLADGQELACDTIVLGVGMVANDELARDAGLACDERGGVLVDAGCRTSDPDILAAGDVAVTPNPWAGRRVRLESWQNAQDQGIAAARSALGHDVAYEPLPWFWSDQYDMNLQIYGVPQPTYWTVLRGTAGGASFSLFYLQGERLMAAIGPNCARDLRFARRLIEKQAPVDPARLANIAVPMAKV